MLQNNLPLIEKIDALLPQTQCGLCNYSGCKPYATALAQGEADIDLCLPGGITTLKAIGTLLEKDPQPFLSGMVQKTKLPTIAVIDENTCIGCTKCIQACPVDAIMGAAKQMHTIITDACTGCELCVPPCPVDCITLVPTTENVALKAEQSRQRFEDHQQRLAQANSEEKKQSTHIKRDVSSRQTEIAEAVARARQKKLLLK